MSTWAQRVTHLLDKSNLSFVKKQLFARDYYVGVLCDYQGDYWVYFIAPDGVYLKEPDRERLYYAHIRTELVQYVVEEYNLGEDSRTIFWEALNKFVQQQPIGFMLCLLRHGQTLTNQW